MGRPAVSSPHSAADSDLFTRCKMELSVIFVFEMYSALEPDGKIHLRLDNSSDSLLRTRDVCNMVDLTSPEVSSYRVYNPY